MDVGDVENHPDLRDDKWLRDVERRARTEVRRSERPGSGRRALVVFAVVAVLGGLAGAWRSGWFDRDTPAAATSARPRPPPPRWRR
ncbi:hypothetical protein SUDANB95_05540 [Actinosynnema sp. ALI-1.44]